MPQALIRLFLISFAVVLGSCGGSDPQPSSTTRELAVSFDSANRTLFFTGSASTHGNFASKLPFSIWFSLVADPESVQNEASAFLLDNHGPHITQRSDYTSKNGKKGEINLLNGRLILRGRVRRDGEELEGTWYFDGLPGGTFWIRP